MKKKLKLDKLTIHPLGYPVMDDLFDANKAFWQKDNISIKFKTPVKLGLLLTMYLPNTALLSKFLNELFGEISLQKNKIILSIRAHPGQPANEIAHLARYHNIEITINPDVSLDNYILNQDILLSWDTTAMDWCMIYGKPLFYCAPNWSEGITPIINLGGAWLVKSPQDLHNKINKLLKNPYIIKQLHKKQKYFLKSVIGIMDGKSSIRHKNLIFRLLNKRTL